MNFDTVFISDVHLGTTRCDTEKFLKFLKELDTKKLVMVGDIFDIACMEHYGTRWRREHTECIHQIFNLAKKGTEIVYILGNHESQLRRYSGFTHHNFSIVDEYVHIDAKGNKFLCVHGDKYSEYSSGSWKQQNHKQHMLCCHQKLPEHGSQRLPLFGHQSCDLHLLIHIAKKTP